MARQVTVKAVNVTIETVTMQLFGWHDHLSRSERITDKQAYVSKVFFVG